MTGVSGTNGTGSTFATSGDSSVQALSPDVLLQYCQMQLGSLDGEIGTQISAQQSALTQRKAIEDLGTAFEQFGSTGPTTAGQLLQCQNDFKAAISELPGGDPVAAQLTTELNTIMTQYANKGDDMQTGKNPEAGTVNDGTKLDNPPTADEWKGVTDLVSGLSDNVKNSAEVQMLSLQDLVSQRQQIVEQVVGMMTKEDQSLEDSAKAIGQ